MKDRNHTSFWFKWPLRLLFIVAAISAIGVWAGNGRSASSVFSADEAESVAAPRGDSGLPLPRFVSLKSDRVNLRQGPSRGHGINWVYTKQGLPVEIIAEYGNWRQVRDSEGEVGWIFHSLLSGRRTVLVAPWSQSTGELTLHRQPDAASSVSAHVEPGVLGTLGTCASGWCQLDIRTYRGWMPQEQLWGVYPNEQIN